MTVYHSSSTHFYVHRTFFSNLVFINCITIGLIFNSIQASASSLVTTNYSNALYPYSPKFARPYKYTGDYYYHAIRVGIFQNGSYSFTSNSSIDTYGSFHYIPVDPTNLYPSLITSDDDSSGNSQFRIGLNLKSTTTYVLLVTTFSPSVTGRFTITVLGPAWVDLSHTELSTVLASTTNSIPYMITSTYSGNLSSSSLAFTRPFASPGLYYYQAMQMTVYTAGTYSFMCNSSIDTYGYLYSGSFDPLNSSANILAYDDDCNSGGQFCINLTLVTYRTYTLVVTTYRAGNTGSFLIKAIGPALLYLTSTNQISQTYYSILTSSSSTFFRPNAIKNCYYYKAIEMHSYTDGTYNFISNSSLDTYGYLYSYSFDPFNPSQNLIASDDESNGNRQFRIIYRLQSYSTYILVVTTYASDITGNIQVTANGPASINLYSYTAATGYPSCNQPVTYPTTNNNDKSRTIIIATVVSVSVISICIVIYGVYQHNLKKKSNQQRIASENNQNIRTHGVPLANPYRNETHTPYYISVPNTVGEQPPSYESVMASFRTRY